MATNYTFPGGVNSYVPTLHQELIVEFSRNPAAFPITKYVNLRKTDKQLGYYISMRNDGQGRIVNTNDSVWPDGNDAPETLYGNDQFEYPAFSCIRRAYVKRYGYLGVDQGAWDLLDQGSRMLAQDAMTNRTYRIHQTLTTSGNWGSNYNTATSLGGGVWGSASSTNPYIRTSLMAAVNTILKTTYGAVGYKDLYVVMNPNTAKVVATSQEFIDFLKQNPTSLPIWEGTAQFQRYNLPEMLFGLNVVVDDTSYNSSLPTATPSFNFTFPDNFALIVSKQQAIKPSAGGAFSTFELFCYQDLETFVYNDVRNRRYELQVIENVDDSVNGLIAPTSGFLISTNS